MRSIARPDHLLHAAAQQRLSRRRNGKIDLHKATREWGLDGKRLLPEWGFSDGVDNAGKGDAVASGAETPKDPYMAFLHKRGLAAAHVADFRKRSAVGYAATHPATHPTPLPEDAYCSTNN